MASVSGWAAASPAHDGAAPGERRPTLGLIVFAVLSTVIALPLLGLFFFRLYDNQLIHQTQAELIAQSAVISTDLRPRDRGINPAVFRLGRRSHLSAPGSGGPFLPIRPALDLAGNDLLARRPDARPAEAAPDPAYLEIAARLLPVMMQTQKVTLAGFRILDPQRHRDCRAPRNRNVARAYRGGRGRAAGALSRRVARAHLRESRRRRFIRSAAARA